MSLPAPRARERAMPNVALEWIWRHRAHVRTQAQAPCAIDAKLLNRRQGRKDSHSGIRTVELNRRRPATALLLPRLQLHRQSDNQFVNRHPEKTPKQIKQSEIIEAAVAHFEL